MNVRAIGIVVFIGLLATFIQGTLLRSLMPESFIAPNLMVVVVAFLAFYEVSALGATLCFLLGLQFDLSSGGLLGPWAGAFVVVYALLCSISQRVFIESPLSAFVAVLSGSIIAQIVYVTLLFQFRTADLLPLSVSLRMILEALFSALCAPLIFALLRRVKLVRG